MDFFAVPTIRQREHCRRPSASHHFSSPSESLTRLSRTIRALQPHHSRVSREGQRALFHRVPVLGHYGAQSSLNNLQNTAMQVGATSTAIQQFPND